MSGSTSGVGGMLTSLKQLFMRFISFVFRILFRKGVEKAPEKEAEKESSYQRELNAYKQFMEDFEKVDARNGVVFRWPTSKFWSLDTLRNLLVDTLLVLVVLVLLVPFMVGTDTLFFKYIYPLKATVFKFLQ